MKQNQSGIHGKFIEKNIPLIKRVETNKAKYIYDTATNKILQVDDDLFYYLQDGYPELDSTHKKTDLSEEKRILQEIEIARKKLGCFATDYPKIDTFPKEQIDTLLDRSLAKGPDLLALNVTERCNLRCKYCAYSGAYFYNRTHSDASMPLDVAMKAVDWYLHFAKDEFHFAFYGGEPLLEINSIKKIVHYVKKSIGNKASFSMTTNAIGLDDEIILFFSDNNFRISISMDGPIEIHDRYRVNHAGRGSFRKVWGVILKLYNNHYEYYLNNVSFNMVLAPPYDLHSIHRFIRSNGHLFKNSKIMISTLNNQPSNLMEKLNVRVDPAEDYRRQKEDMSYLYKSVIIGEDQSDSFFDGLFSRSLVLLHKRPGGRLVSNVPSHGQCIPGDRKCFVDTDGQFYMCERVQTKPIGSVNEGINKAKVVKFLKQYSEFLEDRCYGCWAIRLCSKCFNDIREGDRFSERRFEIHCRAMKRNIFKTLTLYCAIRESNENAFEWADKIIIT